MTEQRSRDTLGILAAIGSAFFFSWKAILAKLIYRTGVSPGVVVGLRMTFSLPVYAALAWIGGKRQPLRLRPRDWGELVLLSLAGYYVATYLDFLGLRYISAGLERLILFLHPVIVVLIGVWAYKRKIARRDAVAMMLGYGGIAFVFLGDVKVAPRSADAWLGASIVFGSSIAYAGYLAFSESAVTRLGATRFTGLVMTIACVFGTVHFVVDAGASVADIPRRALLLAMALAALATAVPTWLLNEAIRRLGSGRASLLSMTGPVVTIFLEALVLGDSVTATDLAGTTCSLAGVLLLAKRPK